MLSLLPVNMMDTLPVKIDEIEAETALFATGVQGRIQDNLVMVFGSKGSGSSTVLNILAGKEIEMLKLRGKHVVDTVQKEYVGDIHAKGFEKLAIIHGRNSVTSMFPNCVNIKDMQFWEVPSFYHQDANKSISNSLQVHTLLRHAAGRRGCKFVVVHDHDSVHGNRGESFMQSLRLICNVFQPKNSQNYEEIINATTFVFSKVPDYVYDAEFTPEFYLSNIIANLTTSQSENELRLQPFEFHACAKYVKEMSRNLKQIRHVEIPRAGAKMDVNNVIRPIVEVIFEKVALSSNFVGCPVITYVGNANLAVQECAVTLRQQVQKCCKSLAILLKDVWAVYESREGKQRVQNTLETLWRVVTTTRNEVRDYEVSDQCAMLLSELEKYSEYANSSYLQLLREMKHIIQQDEMLDTANTCVEYFTRIAASIIDSAVNYRDERQVSEWLRFKKEMDAYTIAADRAWWKGLKEVIQGLALVCKGLVEVAKEKSLKVSGYANISSGLTMVVNANFKPTEPVPSAPEPMEPAFTQNFRN